MTLGYVTNDQFAQIAVPANARFVFLPGNVLISNTGGFFGDENISIQLASSVYASDSAVAIGSSTVAGDFSDLSVEAGVTVHSANFVGVQLQGDTSELTNHGTLQSMGAFTNNHAVQSFGLMNVRNGGTISAATGNGVEITGNTSSGLNATNRVENSGTISGRDGISQSRNLLELINSGTISATRDGVLAEANGALDITNTGTITGTDSAIRGHDTSGQDDIVRNFASGVLSGGIQFFAGNNTLWNAGQVHGEIRNLSGDDLLDNSGQITGEVLMGFGMDDVLNTGRMNGDVDLGDDNDVMRNMGDVFGNVALGAGVDTFDGRGGTVDGVVQGLNGNDTFHIDQQGARIDGGANTDTAHLWASGVVATAVETVILRGSANLTYEGARGDDFVRGNTGGNLLTGGIDGADTLLGRGGEDALEGGGGDDSLEGGSGDDEVLGGDGNDLLMGNSGNDDLDGGDGDDTIVTHAGNDTVVSGGGRDVIRLGNGTDTLIFEGAGEMQNDFVRGFVSGTDVIDLSGIEDTSFTFLGFTAFTSSAMELRLRAAANGDTLVQIDVDGDGALDAQMRMIGVATLSVDDFIL